MKKLILSFLVGGLILMSVGDLFAQDEAKRAYWYVTSTKIKWDRYDSLAKMAQKYIIPFHEKSKELGNILDYNLLLHHSGSDYNYVRMIKHASWDGIEKAQLMTKEQQENWRKERNGTEEGDKEVGKILSYLFEGSTHKDEIFIDVSTY